jgi:hypothetical protein
MNCPGLLWEAFIMAHCVASLGRVTEIGKDSERSGRGLYMALYCKLSGGTAENGNED